MHAASNDLRTALLAAVLVVFGGREDLLSDEPFQPRTRIGLEQGAWQMNGKPTCAGSRAEGLLPNVCMLNAAFEDRNPASCPKGFDPETNTDHFLKALPQYLDHGVRAFTVGLQGAAPGYAGALCSAFEPDGSLRPDYLKRVARIIEACDAKGAAVILSCFSEDQDQVLKDRSAVKKAVTGAVEWIHDRGYRNVLLEVAFEFPGKGFDHEQIREGAGMRELIRLARETLPGLPVSASGGGGGRLDHQVAIEADFLLLHFSNVPGEEILERVASADKVSKAIVCNADRKTGEEGAGALEAAVNALSSWGYLNPRNQRHPFRFEGAADDPVVYAKFKELTTPRN